MNTQQIKQFEEKVSVYVVHEQYIICFEILPQF